MAYQFSSSDFSYLSLAPFDAYNRICYFFTMRLNITRNIVFIFATLLLTASWVKASSLPPIISLLLDQTSLEADPPTETDPPVETDPPTNPPIETGFDTTVVPIPQSGAYHGVYTLNDSQERFTINGRLAGIAQFEQSVYQTDSNSKRVALDRQFYRWNNILRDDSIHPYLLATAALGRIPVASVTSKLSDGSLLDCPDGTDKLAWACIAAGHFDNHLIDMAQKIRDSGVSPFVFTFTHEPEDEIRCNANDDCMGTAAEYVAAWQHIVTVFREQNANNVDFMWIVRDNIFGDTVQAGFPTADQIYPGDDYIDWIAADVYNFAFRSGSEFDWRSLSEVATEFYAWGSQRPKPLAFGEWGSREEYFNAMNDGTRKAEWLDEANTWLQTQATRIKAVMYFNIYVEGEFNNPDEFGNTGPDWRVDTTSKSLQAYQRLAQDPYFIGIDTPN